VSPHGIRRYASRYATFIIAGVLLQPIFGQARPPEKEDELKAFFQHTEQSLVDSVALGDKSPWLNVLDDGCVITNEEGEVQDKSTFLKELTGLPQGLSGGIEVTDLTVQQFGDIAVVRFLMNEKETVFGQQLSTSYRSTDTFRKHDGRWKMIASHQSVITSDPPSQNVSKDLWPALVGRYQLVTNGWTFEVQLKDGQLYGGRDPHRLARMIHMASNVFVREGTLGDWIFTLDADGKPSKLIELRKFEPLVWTRVVSDSKP